MRSQHWISVWEGIFQFAENSPTILPPQVEWLSVPCYSHNSLLFLFPACKTAVPNFLVTRDHFSGKQFFHRAGVGRGTVSGWLKCIIFIMQIISIMITSAPPHIIRHSVPEAEGPAVWSRIRVMQRNQFLVPGTYEYYLIWERGLHRCKDSETKIILDYLGKWYKCQSLSHVWLFVTLRAIAHPRDWTGSPASQADSLLSKPPGKLRCMIKAITSALKGAHEFWTHIHTEEKEAKGPQRQRLEWRSHRPRNRSWKRSRTGAPLEPQKGAGPCWHLDFGFVASRTRGE